jgi:Flp pilus assembly protein TadD
VSCRHTLILLAGVLCFVAFGCSRTSRRPVERLAVSPFENLSDDPSMGWVGWALSEVVVTEANGSGRLHLVRVAGERNLAASAATSALTGYITMAGGRVRLHAARSDLTSRRVTGTFDAEEAFPGDLLRMGGALARWIEPSLRPFDTESVEALRAFAEGREAEDETMAAKAYERSIALDPNFGAPYVTWAQSMVVRGNRDGAEELLAKARSRGDRISPARRAELDLLAAALSGDRAGRRRALVALSHATPADADVFGQLAGEESAARRFDAAVEAYRRAATLDPLNVSTWNQLGYAEAARRNLEGARSALTEYAHLEPRNANPADSLGDVHYHLGVFGQAERHYLEAYEKDPAFLGGADLYKAARARLMTGDLGGAEGLFRRYLGSTPAARDGLADYRQAQWLYLTGRREMAVARMKRFAVSTQAPQGQSQAALQLSVWGSLAGAREGGDRWEKTAGERGRALDLLLSGRFVDAIPLLEGLVARSTPLSSDRLGVLLAWALVETDRFKEAAPLLETYGVPPPGLEEPFAGLAFPRVFQLRAVVLEKEGRSREAAEARQVFQRLSGK